jgi:acyl-CoA reductase-like NAD-dependent aldehyde dehydrogenase
LISREETFGPVVTIDPVDSLDDAIRRCNETRFGLTASIFTSNLDAALRFAGEVDAGMVHTNGGTVQEEAHVPFGGVGDSGFGREGALVGIDELTQWKWVTLGPHRP